MGGTGSREMTALAKEIWELALSQKIIITAEYLPGELNVRANWASRNFQESSRWLLAPKVFQMISRDWGTPEIGFFASRACHQLHTYMAWRPDPHSQPTDALQQKCKNIGLLYAFPPFITDRKSSLKSQGRMINNNFGNSKLACTILVQSNPRSVHNRVSTPAPISGTFGRSQGTSVEQVLNKTLKLMAWKISGKTWLRKKSQTRLPILSQIPEDQALQLITYRPEKNGLAGVVNDRLIRLHAV